VRPDTVTVDINAQPPSQPCTYEKYRDCEDVWLIPVLQKLGVYNIEEYNRRIIKDQPGEHIKYAYTIFFTKYPGPYHAYAKVNEHEGGVIMLCQYYTALDSMAKTLAHETCHVFGAEDEYSQDGYKNCTCNPTGYYNVPNYNCVNCRNQDWSPHQCMMEETAVPVLCSWSRGQIGWNYVQFSNALGSQQSYGPETRTFSFECNTKTYMFAYSNESWSVWELTQMGPGDYPVAEGKVEGEWNIVVPYEAHDQDYQMWNLQEYTAFIFVQCQDKKWFIAKVPLSGDTLVPIIDGESDCLYSSAFSFISANGDSSLFAFEDVGPGAVKHPWSILSISKIRGTREPESLIKQSGGDFDYNYSVAFSFMYKQDQNSYAFPYIYAQTATECKWFIAKLTVNGIERVNTGKLDAYYSLSAPFVNLNDPSDNPYMLALDTREVWPIWVIVQLTDTGNRLGTVLDSGRMKATSIMLYTWNNKNYILKHESPEFGSGSYWRTLQFAAGAGAIFTV
ncbi:MAG TPA: hypothetical protein VK826_11575, partial [Bacteroidia bacterium]|nr:hypothetical protein [Bacteroidia bacterium]